MNFGPDSNRSNNKNTRSLFSGLRKRINFALFAMLFAILLCWGLFFYYTVIGMRDSSRQLTQQVSTSIINTLENTFLNLVHNAVMLSSNDEVIELLLSDSTLEYHENVSRVKEVLNATYQPNGLADDILIYDSELNFARLRGTIGNTAAKRIGFIIDSETVSGHVSLTVEDIPYIGYVREIILDNEHIGTLVYLMDTLHLETLFNEYSGEGELSISLLTDDVVVASCNQDLIANDIDGIVSGYDSYNLSSIETTPFSMLVVDEGSGFSIMVQIFTVSAIVTIALIVGLQVLFYRIMGRFFLDPMIAITENIESLDLNSDLLSETGNVSFDRLVWQINDMILRLEDSQRSLYDMNYKMQQSEIEKQNAIILSLKKQINAHFTVNTINIIKRLAEMGKIARVGEMCDNLSNILRYANNSQDYISGFEEMYVLEKYIEIMHTRYPGSFVAEFEADDELDSVFLPRMLLQPIVENSVMHGISGVKAGRIKVTGKLHGPNVVFQIHDNGVGLAVDKLGDLRTKLNNATGLRLSEGLSGVALLNIQKRVVSQYGAGFGLSIESTKNVGTVVTLTLPARREEDFAAI